MKSQNHPGYKTKRVNGDPIGKIPGNPRFFPIPKQFSMPDGDLSMDLSEVMSQDKADAIAAAGKMMFHIVGDTGPIKGDAAFKPVTQQMEAEADESYLFYHLGDIVYFNGKSTDYENQFYTYVDGYPGKIVAIPGNHDCSNVVRTGDAPDGEPSLLGFMLNFCADAQVYHDQSAHRKNMNQPWAYWTLTTPVVTIIGLFSNNDGMLDEDNNTTQYEWFVQALKNAAKDKKIIVTVHHPCFSMDAVEGGYSIILNDLDQAFLESGRYPDLVLSGHVHNYQRFTRAIHLNDGTSKLIPYVIAGGGGYAETAQTMHKLMLKVDGSRYPTNEDTPIDNSLLSAHNSPISNYDLTLNSYNEEMPGFLRLTADMKNNNFLVEYVTVPFDGDPGVPATFDSFNF